jgi:MFS transporter, DHA1 family, multidrug resistance protein
MVLLGCLGAFVPLAVDMYLPGWPDVQRTLDASASAVQLTLTTFLLGLAAGQLVAGPLSDRVGRRLPLLTGIAGFVVASVACALADDSGAHRAALRPGVRRWRRHLRLPRDRARPR